MNIQGVQQADFHIRNSFSPLCTLTDMVLFPHKDSMISRFWTEQMVSSASPKRGSGSELCFILSTKTTKKNRIPFLSLTKSLNTFIPTESTKTVSSSLMLELPFGTLRTTTLSPHCWIAELMPPSSTPWSLNNWVSHLRHSQPLSASLTSTVPATWQAMSHIPQPSLWSTTVTARSYEPKSQTWERTRLS